MHGYQIRNAMGFLEAFGFEFHLDFNNEVEIIAPTKIDPHAIVVALHRFPDQMRGELLYRARRLLQQHFGGPLHGQPVRPGACYPTPRVYHLGRARWAAYAMHPDGRAIYAGEATNRAEARRLALNRQPTFNSKTGRFENGINGA